MRISPSVSYVDTYYPFFRIFATFSESGQVRLETPAKHDYNISNVPEPSGKFTKRRFPMIKDDCIFCKIANGEIPSATVYEDDNFRAILDIAPAHKGHTIILPKQHFANLYETDDEFAALVLPVAKKVAKAQKQVLGCDGVNILQNNEPAAGQTVFHLHVHVVPRFENDGILPVWPQGSYEDGEAAELAKKLSASM